jgi:hypothetical protein
MLCKQQASDAVYAPFIQIVETNHPLEIVIWFLEQRKYGSRQKDGKNTTATNTYLFFSKITY